MSGGRGWGGEGGSSDIPEWKVDLLMSRPYDRCKACSRFRICIFISISDMRNFCISWGNATALM